HQHLSGGIEMKSSFQGKSRRINLQGLPFEQERHLSSPKDDQEFEIFPVEARQLISIQHDRVGALLALPDGKSQESELTNLEPSPDLSVGELALGLRGLCPILHVDQRSI